MGWRFCSLNNVPNAAINDFDCEDEDINHYLQKVYLDPEDNNGFSRNFIMIHESNPTKIVGFYTLSYSSIEAKELPPDFMKGRTFPCPAILIGQFGIDKTEKGKRFSQCLLWDVYRRIILLYKGDSAFNAIRVDTRKAPDTQERTPLTFWENQGFIRLQKRKTSLFLPIQTLIRELEADLIGVDKS